MGSGGGHKESHAKLDTNMLTHTHTKHIDALHCTDRQTDKQINLYMHALGTWAHMCMHCTIFSHTHMHVLACEHT